MVFNFAAFIISPRVNFAICVPFGLEFRIALQSRRWRTSFMRWDCIRKILTKEGSSKAAKFKTGCFLSHTDAFWVNIRLCNFLLRWQLLKKTSFKGNRQFSQMFFEVNWRQLASVINSFLSWQILQINRINEGLNQTCRWWLVFQGLCTFTDGFESESERLPRWLDI